MTSLLLSAGLMCVGLAYYGYAWWRARCGDRAARERDVLRAWAIRAPTSDKALEWMAAIDTVPFMAHVGALVRRRDALHLYPTKMVDDYLHRDEAAAYDPALQG